MRTLILLQGIPASGKSSFVKNQNLEPFTISSDKIRMMNSGLILKENNLKINNHQDNKNWEMIYTILENRFQNGLLTFFDATNCSESSFEKISNLARKYYYDIRIISFKQSLENAIKFDSLRPTFQQVGKEVISHFYEKLNAFPSHKYKYLSQENWRQEVLEPYKVNFSNYEKVFAFGDLQSCATPVRDFFKENSFSDKNLYIFVGDFFDRGIEHKEVAELLLELYNKPNVILICGNHERHLFNWINSKEIKSEEFKNDTLPHLVNLKSKLTKVLPKFKDFIIGHTNDGKEFLISHSGVSKWLSDEELTFISSNEFVFSKGYKEPVESAFELNSKENQYQIHGHRNPEQRPFNKSQRSFCLEGRIEFGGFLKILKIEKEDIIMIEIKNKVVKTINSEEVIMNLTSDPTFIKEKDLGNDIFSYNFTRKAFYKKQWNDNTIKARGLFIHKPMRKIVARSYDKFFNINEMEETKLENLNFSFPINIFLKENGFLGIVSYNHITNDLFFASKSTNQGDFVEYLKEIWKKSNLDDLKIKQYMKEANVSFVFEVMDIKNDPHIIEYKESKIILLDVIFNEFEFKRYDYEHLKKVGKKLNFEVKQLYKTIHSKEEFDLFYNESIQPDFTVNGCPVEGFVIEDQKNFMVKIKCYYYNFWKKIRGLKDNEKFMPRTKTEEEILEFIINNNLREENVIEIAKKYIKNINPS